MKKSIAILAVIAFATIGIHSQSFAGFQTAFQSLAGDIAASLATDSTIGSDWSDAYVGGFPHFGVGLATGATFVNVASASTLFATMGAAMPSAFSKYGIPIPAAVATLKIGIPFLPLDIGVKAGYIPPSIGKTLLCDTGVDANYQNIGIQIRYALMKQNALLPNVSIGVAYDYQQGSLSAPTGIGSQSLSYGGYSVTMTNPNLDLGWTSSTFDFTAQVSKKLLFLVPYIGAGYTVGSSTVTGGLDSDISTNYPTGINGLANYIEANGGTAPDFSSGGFSYSVVSDSPVFRVYGGLSFRIFILDFDVQALYVPVSRDLGASFTTRLQF